MGFLDNLFGTKNDTEFHSKKLKNNSNKWETKFEEPSWIDLGRAEDQIPIHGTKIVKGHHYMYKLEHITSDNSQGSCGHGVVITGRKRI